MKNRCDVYLSKKQLCNGLALVVHCFQLNILGGGKVNLTQTLPDLIVFSHLRWDFVFQRPQHLLTRHARVRRVFYFEEPVFTKHKNSRLMLHQTTEGVFVATPELPEGMPFHSQTQALKHLVDELLVTHSIETFTLWYYTPMALPFSRHLRSKAVIYDCMDELSNFKFAPTTLVENEVELMRRAGVVFTGGHSLFEAKRHRHHNIHPMPSSIDRDHFSKARNPIADPQDQARLPRPRLGFFGVIDERMDLGLIEGVARLRPDWQLVMIGPVVKIDPATLPVLPNIQYLGMKDYQELPSYLAHWDVAMMPFARNDSTRFISPTKTPEYLAAGCPVVSTSIRDVVRPYGEEGLVAIADTPEGFVHCVEQAMRRRKFDAEWLVRVDEFLFNTSWDLTWRNMMALERALYQTRVPRVARRTHSEPSMQISPGL